MDKDQREAYTLISLAMLYSPNTSTHQPSMIGDNRVTNRIGAVAGGKAEYSLRPLRCTCQVSISFNTMPMLLGLERRPTCVRCMKHASVRYKDSVAVAWFYSG
jgi:hypothetical protein